MRATFKWHTPPGEKKPVPYVDLVANEETKEVVSRRATDADKHRWHREFEKFKKDHPREEAQGQDATHATTGAQVQNAPGTLPDPKAGVDPNDPHARATAKANDEVAAQNDPNRVAANANAAPTPTHDDDADPNHDDDKNPHPHRNHKKR